MTAHVVTIDDARASRSLEHALRLLEGSGLEAKPLDLRRGSIRLDRESRSLERRFQHTPQPLLDAWRASRLIQERTNPGDVVLMSDHRGLGGVFALDQAAAGTAHRRHLWTVAADSAYLELRFVAGAHEGLPMPLESQIDWEIVQYRWSDRTIATSELAIRELERIGVTSELISEQAHDADASGRIDPRSIWAPGPVSRRNQTGEVLRAGTSLDGTSIALSDEDADDGIWTGLTWDALRHSREVLEGRVDRRHSPPESPTVIVVGDPFSPPDQAVAAFRSNGVPVVVPEGSVASLIWPKAPTWAGAGGLVDALTDAPAERTGSCSRVVARSAETVTPSRLDRARAVSVAIPVFRDVRFLEECVKSVLGQDHAPVEVLLIDDGSRSDVVDKTFDDLIHHDQRVRNIRTEHRGVCVARNAAMEAMTGDSFLFVDSDDILLPTFLSRCASVLNSSEEVWAVATWTEFFGAYEAVEAKPPFDERVGRRENPIISTSALVDRKVLEAGIRFAPDLAFLYCEDWHFWSQIVAAGGRFGLVPEPLAKHRVHPTSGGYMRTELAHALGRSRAIEPLRR